LSRQAESLPWGEITGISFGISSPKSGDSITHWRACIQLTFPLTVLISPLWQM
jgi:hypothetical protein